VEVAAPPPGTRRNDVEVESRPGPQDFQDVLRAAKAVLAATLVNASIEFSTLYDDKDQKTLLTVAVVDFERVVAARAASRFGQFVDHTESGPA
jgi:hypothetical protein